MLLLSFLSIGLTVYVMRQGEGMSPLKVGLLVSSFSLFMGSFGMMLWTASPKTRRRLLKWLIPLCALLVILGVSFKFLRLPSAAIQVILGTFAFAFVVGPAVARNRYDQWINRMPSRLKLVGIMTGDSMGFSLIALGLLFWLQRWPAFPALILLGLVMLILSSIFWNGAIRTLFEERERANEALAKAHEQITEKNKEITDSIIYAQRIQEAILPPKEAFDQHLPAHFLLYQPKDIVAGDFYWLERVEDVVLFAAADCTGHGVPGAMVSVICSNALNKSVREFGLQQPSAVLDKCLELVVKRFEQSTERVQDGMDIALCALDVSSMTLQFAGANNPLWIIHTDNTMTELKATKQPIGNYAEPKAYEHHEVQLSKGDTIYVFSDGFPDQFGGPKGKKLKTRGFRDYLLSIQDKTMTEQHVLLAKFFDQWRGSHEQIDDVCLIGVRV